MLNLFDIDDHQFESEKSIIDIVIKTLEWKKKSTFKRICIDLKEMGIIYTDQSTLLPIWIPIYPLFFHQNRKLFRTLNLLMQSPNNVIGRDSDFYVKLVSIVSNNCEPIIQQEEMTQLFHSVYQYRPLQLRQSMSTIIVPGSFDFLHQGHINLLKSSKCLGSKVIVIIDSDHRLTSRKGDNRPIKTISERITELKKTGLVNEVRVLGHQEEFELILKEYNDPFVVKGAEYRHGFLEFEKRTGRWWNALCIESHSNDRSSNQVE